LVLADWSGDGRLDAAVASSSADAVWALEATPAVSGAARRGAVPGSAVHPVPFRPEIGARVVPFRVEVGCTVDAQPFVEAPRGLQAWPNPARGGTTLRFGMGRAGRAELAIYDVAGRLVRNFPAADHPAGTHSVPWDCRDDRGQSLPSGIYFATLRSPASVERLRLVVVQ
jgi:hypothetical protein